MCLTKRWLRTFVRLLSGVCVFFGNPQVYSRTPKKAKSKLDKPPRMSSEEKRLIRSMVFDQKMKPTDVAEHCRRPKTAIWVYLSIGDLER